MSGNSTSALSNERPKNCARASTSPAAIPKGRLAAVATVATRRLSLIAVISSGVSISTMLG